MLAAFQADIGAAADADPVWRRPLTGESALDVRDLLSRTSLSATAPDAPALRPASLPGLLDGVLAGNLSARIAQRQHAIATAAVEREQGAFDPVFSLSTTGLLSHSVDRGAIITRLRGVTPPVVAPDAVVQPDEVGCLRVDGQILNPTDPNCFVAPTLSSQFEFASVASGPHTVWQWSARAALEKLWTWGPRTGIALSSQMRHKNSYSTDFNWVWLSTTDPYGFGGRSPWTSTAQVFASTPLPFTKGFGPWGVRDAVDVVIAEGLEQRAQWQERAQRDLVVQQTLIGYWALVDQYLRLQTVGRHLSTMEERLARTQRRYDTGLATNYDLAQVQAAVENLRDRIEILWNGYVAQSMQLLTLAAEDAAAVLVPVGFEAALGAPPTLAVQGAASRAVETNPLVHAALANVRISDAELEYRENQLRPDLSLDISFGVAQSDTAFGYETWSDSVTNLFDPDSHSLAAILRFRLPLWQQGEEARAARARAERRQSLDRLTQTRMQVTDAANDGLLRLYSAQAQIVSSEADVTQAATAYEKALDMIQRELVTEFELLRRYDDVLSARLRLVDALVQARVAEVRLLAAEGRLEESAHALLKGVSAQ